MKCSRVRQTHHHHSSLFAEMFQRWIIKTLTVTVSICSCTVVNIILATNGPITSTWSAYIRSHSHNLYSIAYRCLNDAIHLYRYQYAPNEATPHTWWTLSYWARYFFVAIHANLTINFFLVIWQIVFSSAIYGFFRACVFKYSHSLWTTLQTLNNVVFFFFVNISAVLKRMLEWT